MNAVTFDTYKIIKRLTSEGITEKQATVIVEAIQEVREIDLNGAVTKAKLAKIKVNLIKWMFSEFLVATGLLLAVLVRLH